MSKEDDILYEIDELKKEITEIKEKEVKILEDEQLIKNQTQALLAEENQMEKKLTKMKYSDITQWKSAIWEHCEYRETRAGDVMISYWCTKLNAPCRFEDCPLNQW